MSEEKLRIAKWKINAELTERYNKENNGQLVFDKYDNLQEEDAMTRKFMGKERKCMF
jgi:hypothetical protein